MRNKQAQEKDILTIKEVADLLRVKPSTIRYWVFTEKMPYIKFGKSGSSTVRYSRIELLKWIEKHSYKPKE